MISEKTCRTCGYVGPVEDFVKQRRLCKKCQKQHNKEMHKKHYEENREKLIAKSKEAWLKLKETDPEKLRARGRKWIKDNPEKKRAFSLKYREENPEKCTAIRKNHYEKNKEHVGKVCKEWRRNNVDKVKIYSSNNRATRKNIPGFHTLEEILALYEKQEGRCVYCGCDISRGYHVDHIIPVVREGATNWVSNLQLLCPTCNRSKGRKTHEEYLEYCRRIGRSVVFKEAA